MSPIRQILRQMGIIIVTILRGCQIFCFINFKTHGFSLLQMFDFQYVLKNTLIWVIWKNQKRRKEARLNDHSGVTSSSPNASEYQGDSFGSVGLTKM